MLNKTEEVTVMRRIMVVVFAAALSLSLLAAADAAPAGKVAAPPGKTTVRKESKGMQNAKKVMQARFDRMKKTQDMKRQGIARREQEIKK